MKKVLKVKDTTGGHKQFLSIGRAQEASLIE